MPTAPSFDVVVVDDASRDASAVASVVAHSPRSRLVRGVGAGPAAARNLGATHSHAPVVCFTDDDCRPAPTWVATLERTVGRGLAAAAGPTMPARTIACPVAAQTITNHLVAWSRNADGTAVEFATTSNLACTRELLTAIPFDETFPLAAGEDRDWCRRVADAGATIAYAPDAVVLHDPDPTFAAFWRQQLRYGRGSHHLHRSRPRGDRIPPAPFYSALARASWSHGVTVTGLVALAQVATTVGYAQAAFAAR